MIEWPPRSSDLSPLEFFYWGYLKNKVYETKPTSVDDLKEKILNVSNLITPEILRIVRYILLSLGTLPSSRGGTSI